MIHQGLTWDHPRGYMALAAAAEKAAAEGRPVVAWSKQPLEGFESHPIAELASRFDLLVLDHPHIGEAVAADCLRPLEELFTAEEIAVWQAETVGPAMASYAWQGRHLALPHDVATQVMAYRADLVAEPPVTFGDVVRLAETAPVAVSISGPHALCTFFSVCVALGEEPGGEALVSDATAREALSLLSRLARTAPAGTATMNPIRLLETLAASDAIALVPHIYGYVNYARPSAGRRAVAFADAPVAAPGGRPGSVLGGTGIAVTRRAEPDTALIEHLRWLMRGDTQAGFIPDHEGQPSARAAWLSDRVNAAAGDFYRATLRTVERAFVRPRHNGYIAFQAEGSAILRETILDGRPIAGTIARLREAWARSFMRLPASAHELRS
jgi:multiple sugar transport system substrate-binding protein